MDAVRPDANVGIEGGMVVAIATPPSVAALLGLSEGHLANLRCYGGGPPFVKWRGRVLYPTAALQQWLIEDAEAKRRRAEAKPTADAQDHSSAPATPQ